MDNHDKNMTTGNVVISWGIAALAGFIAFLLFRIMGDWTFSAAGFGGGFIALILVVIFTIIFGRDLTPPQAPQVDLRPRPVGPDAPVPTATAAPKGAGAAPTVDATETVSPDTSVSKNSAPATPDTTPKATAPVAPKAAPAATAAVVAGSAGTGGGAAAATSPAATGTPVGEGAISATDRRENEAASRAAISEQPVTAPATGPGTKPQALDAPRGGTADDLKRIKGVGPKMETMLNGMGFWHFDQIASWSDQEVAWVDQNLEGFKGRVTRDEWVPQARALAAGETTAFSTRVDKGDVY
ncbi:hypothetical protein [Jannaschia donghaensis]|uniref:NADH dehydrogenase subunit E n=1 Tax=Jannaschia donghaensis TaxID=420998 RepID=A0A0M6YIN3_9RHOB|nr:hypothetical protein [Jannaschia donghaensis]CTQ49629.1 NADH dehydrogenase subunit E [Jannaschia donghaensis]